ncbi:hypothetical protein, partial [Acetobacter conturbans]|uniref:hypothetical protein n=1 Tax=Acetobacter conturbans TaxID=1737472 RepID=UPI001A7E4A4A
CHGGKLHDGRTGDSLLPSHSVAETAQPSHSICYNLPSSLNPFPVEKVGYGGSGMSGLRLLD